MRNKIIKYLEKNKIEINTKTQEEYNELMEYLDFYNFRWQDNESLMKSNCYKYNKEKTLILLQEWYEVAFSYIGYNSKQEFSIITFQDFKKEFIEKDLAYQLHLSKQLEKNKKRRNKI